MTQQVEVTGRSEGIVLPDCEEHRTLQDKPFALVGDAESVEQSLERVTGKENLKIGLFDAGAREQSGAHRVWNGVQS